MTKMETVPKVLEIIVIKTNITGTLYRLSKLPYTNNLMYGLKQ